MLIRLNYLNRLLRSETDRAISIGFTMLRICSTIHATELALQIYPLLLQALLIKKRISEAVSLLHEVEYFAEEDTDNSGKLWPAKIKHKGDW